MVLLVVGEPSEMLGLLGSAGLVGCQLVSDLGSSLLPAVVTGPVYLPAQWHTLDAGTKLHLCCLLRHLHAIQRFSLDLDMTGGLVN